MKIASAVLLFLALSTVGMGKEIFVARATYVLTNREWTWRVEETRQGLRVRVIAPKMKASADITGPEAQALRAKIAIVVRGRCCVARK